MEVGQTSQVVRTRLGFHIIELTDLKPARQMSLDEARPEVALALRNEKRAGATEDLIKELVAGAEFVQSDPPK
jgi:parvulin-like peptidyl-prolyl isomerase